MMKTILTVIIAGMAGGLITFALFFALLLLPAMLSVVFAHDVDVDVEVKQTVEVQQVIETVEVEVEVDVEVEMERPLSADRSVTGRSRLPGWYVPNTDRTFLWERGSRE